ncbi:MAG: sugar transferase [Candidatus Uhrbacteria bacterium]|nr:sugar transferase [Candidatus Uhrbacteria bacterium]
MKRSDLTFAALLIPLDFVMLMCAGIFAYFLRFTALASIRPVILEIPFTEYIVWSALVALFFIFILALSGLYSIGFRRIQNEVQRIFTACSTAIMLVVVFIFFQQELFTSRFIIIAIWLLSIGALILGRSLLRALRVVLFLHGVGVHPIALIGPAERTRIVVRDFSLHPSHGYRVAALFDEFSDTTKQELTTQIANKHIDEIIVVDPSLSRSVLQEIAQFATYQHVPLRYAADIVAAKRLAMTMLAGIPLIEIKRTKLEGWGRILKRFCDIIISFIAIIILAPVFVVIAILIKLDSPGPVIYKNIRVGQRGLFPTYKFRSMYIDVCTGPSYDASGKAEQLQDELVQSGSQRKGPVFKVLKDPRRTRVGRILERTSLDELPQLFNVFFGNMSLVGPRPHMPREVAGYDIKHHQLFSVKPGVTGLAQISGRSDLDFDDEVRLDLLYVENWSPFFDFVILCKTPFAVLARKSNV